MSAPLDATMSRAPRPKEGDMTREELRATWQKAKLDIDTLTGTFWLAVGFVLFNLGCFILGGCVGYALARLCS